MGKQLTDDQRRRLAELEKDTQEVLAESEALWKDIEKTAREEERYLDVLVNADKYIGKIEETFEQRTGLNRVDTVLLFVATVLQLFRIYVLPKIEEMLHPSDAQDNGDLASKMEQQLKEFLGKQIQGAQENGKTYRSWHEIVANRRVPYDAVRHTGERPGAARMKVLGQDPLFGWIFGVANIMTDTVSIGPDLGRKNFSFSDIETYEVDMGPGFCWKEQIETSDMFEEAKASYDEDKHRLYAAVFAHGLHQETYMYHTLGLPVPRLSSQNPVEAYDLYSSGYDCMDSIFDSQLADVFLKSGKTAMLINGIIAGIHQLFFDPTSELNRDLYTVKTKRIILYSNLIATGSDVVQASIRASNGDADAIKDLDWGGLVVTMFHLIYDTKFIMKVKEEFVFNEWARMIESEDNILNN